jgi:hypothetical protein
MDDRPIQQPSKLIEDEYAGSVGSNWQMDPDLICDDLDCRVCYPNPATDNEGRLRQELDAARATIRRKDEDIDGLDDELFNLQDKPPREQKLEGALADALLWLERIPPPEEEIRALGRGLWDETLENARALLAAREEPTCCRYHSFGNTRIAEWNALTQEERTAIVAQRCDSEAARENTERPDEQEAKIAAANRYNSADDHHGRWERNAFWKGWDEHREFVRDTERPDGR